MKEWLSDYDSEDPEGKEYRKRTGRGLFHCAKRMGDHETPLGSKKPSWVSKRGGKGEFSSQREKGCAIGK